MRILMVSDFFPPVTGGLEAYVDDLAAELTARGHEVHVATITTSARPSDARVAVHPVRTLTSHLINPETADRPFAPPLPDPVARRDLGAILREVDPDVVHAHSWLGASLPRRRPPTVLTVHDYALACPRHTFWRSDDRICAGPSLAACVRCGRASYGPVKSPVVAAATIAGRRVVHPDAVLALSDHVRRRIGPYLSVGIEVIPGFLRAGPARPESPATPPAGAEGRATPPVPTGPSGPFALFAGDPRRHKGIDVILEAWGDGPPGGLRLVIATSRPFQHRLPLGVRTCSLSKGQMAGAWRAAELAVVPSVWEEPFGLVAMEALAAGTPVVASRVGALPEIVTDGVDGLLVPPGDPVALRGAVQRLAGDARLRRRLGEQAAEGAARFAAGTIVPRIEAVYRRVAARAVEAVRS